MTKETRLPNFVVIGAPKSGTTSLFYYLAQHPEIYLPVRKELHYFSRDTLASNANGPGDKIALQAICKNINDYTAHYFDASDEKAIGEVSPSYLYYDQTAKRILDELGEIRIIAILRNPIEKAHSQYMHLIRDNRETLTFPEALDAEAQRADNAWSDLWRYAESSLYSKRLSHFIDIFGAGRVKVLLFDDLIADPDALMADLFGFLGADPSIKVDTSEIFNRTGKPRSKFVSDFFARPSIIKSLFKKMIPEEIRIRIRLAAMDLNTGQKGTMDPEAKDYLIEYFNKDVRELERIISRDLPWLT